MPELIPVNIVIADRTYRLKIDAVDEEIVRKTVKMINEKILEFKVSLAGKDLQDYVSMVLLWYATEQTKGGTDLVKEQETSSKLASIEALLDNALKV